ncbi:unnamed protein product [Nippostrongylus brasiliensis]|uniref:MFS domain-containing protein n=1 Tax=Nippostrongylus brasiliensis TaxID=27835 RepID=A0A0N4YF00_NIPBR|nr:unnamed protein product [Nippostrongylus brasiliensis]
MAESNGCAKSDASNSSLDDIVERRVIFSCFGINRYFVLVLGLLFNSFLMSCLIAWNSAYSSMLDRETSPLYNGSLDENIDWASPDLPLADRRFVFHFTEKSLSFAGGFAGSTLGTIPFNMLMLKFGPHKVLTAIGIISTIAVALHPIVLCWSFPLFVILRIITGFSIAIPFPVAGYIVNEWAPVKEKGLFVATLSGYVELSALITMPLGAWLANAVSWPSVFYIHAIICGIFTILWAVYFRDKASNHPFVGANEWKRISVGKPPKVEAIRSFFQPPISKIFRSKVIWSIWCAVIGNYLVAQFLVSYSPIFFTYALGYSTVAGGGLTALPLICQLVVKTFTGIASDRLTCLPELGKLRLFSSVALLGSGVLFIVLAVVCPVGNAVDVLFIILPVALIGFTSGGYPKCVVLVSRQYTPFVMSVVQVGFSENILLSSQNLRPVKGPVNSTCM